MGKKLIASKTHEYLGNKFDSKEELDFYKYLVGIHGVHNVEMKLRYKLIDGFITNDGKKQSAMHYTPDFKVGDIVYEYKGGMFTEPAKMRCKLFRHFYRDLTLKIVTLNPDKSSMVKYVDYDQAEKWKREHEKTKPRKNK